MQSSAYMIPEPAAEFATLLQEHQRLIFRVAGSYARARADIEDLAQEIAAQAWRAFPSYDAQRRFSTWLYTISRRVAIDRGIARRRLEERTLPEEAADPLEDTQSTSEAAELEQVGDAVRQAMIGDLDPLEAQVVYLHYVDGLSLPAITELLDCRNKSGAKAYLVGGMRKLRRRFQQPAETKSTVV